MLMIFDKLGDIDFRQLMDVYSESNIISGDKYYRKYPKNLRILYAEQDFYNNLVLFFKEPSARYAVWNLEGRYTAALRTERYSDGLLITALETAPDQRCKGIASMLMTAVLEHLKTVGNGRLYSHVDKDNEASLAAHARCGFRIMSDLAVYLDGTVVTNAYTLCKEY